MTILPILLSAVAVLLAAAAFFKALAAGNASEGNVLLREAVVGLSDRVGSIQESLQGIAQDLSDARGSLRELPSELRSQSAALRGQAELLEAQTAVIGALPVKIAEATDASATLSETRAVRESLQSVAAGFASVKSSQDAATKAATAGFSSLTESVASLGRDLSAGRNDDRVADLLREGVELGRSQAGRIDAIASSLTPLSGQIREATETLAAIRSDEGAASSRQDRLLEAVGGLASAIDSVRDALVTLPVRTAEEIAARPAPAPELEELAVAVRDAGGLRGDAVRSVADAVSRVSDRLEASADEGRVAREEAASHLARSLSTLESVADGVREALLPLGDALRGHGEAVIPVVKGFETAQDRLEEAAVSLRANQVEFAASVGVFTNAAQDLSTGLGAFAREGAEDAARDPAAIQQALLESLERLLVGFTESLRSALADADVRHREALVEIASRLPERAG